MAQTTKTTQASNLPKGANVFNYIRSKLNESYLKDLPEATKTNIATIKDVLFNEAYQPMLNDFVGNLINRIGLTIIRNKSYDNSLAMFKKGSIPLGTDIQDVFENPAKPEEYELNDEAMAKILKITDPDTHVAYYRRNRRDLFTKSISREALQGAFVSWEKFEEYIAQITTSLYSGNNISEFKYTKALVDGAYLSNKVIVNKVDAVIDETTAKAFVKKCKKLYGKMKFASTEYNAYSKFSGSKGTIETFTPPERICMIVTTDVLAEIDVECLAAAFNLSKVEFMGRIVEVDSFANPEIQAVICDESWLQIYDNLLRFDESYNARCMVWNEYLHAWNTFAICPFANAVCLATEIPVVPAETLKFNPGTQLELKAGDVVVAELEIAPKNAGPIVFDSQNNSYAKVKKIDDTHVEITAVGSGLGGCVAKVEGHSDVTATLKINVTEA